MSTGVFAREIPANVIADAAGGSYEIPANYLAIVRVEVENGKTFIIDGETVLFSDAVASKQSGSASNVGASPVTLSGITPSATQSGECWVWATAGTHTTRSLLADGIVIGTYSATNGTATRILVPPGVSALQVTGSGGSNDTVSATYKAFSEGAAPGPIPGVFKLKAGQVISGGRYVVELYAVPGTDEEAQAWYNNL